MECLIVDDCSQDDSILKCKEIISSYKGSIVFKVLCHDVNKGVSRARNTGVKAAAGRYLFFLDSDDEITPNCISSLHVLATKYPDVELVQGYTKSIPDKEYYHIEQYFRTEYNEDNRMLQKEIYRDHFPCQAYNKLIRRDFIIDNNLYFKEGIVFEDSQWIIKMARVLNRVAFSMEPSYLRFFRQGSIMTSTDNTKCKIDSVAVIIEDVINHIDQSMRNYQLGYIVKEYYIWFRDTRFEYYDLAMEIFNSIRRYSLLAAYLFMFWYRFYPRRGTYFCLRMMNRVLRVNNMRDFC